MREDEAEDLDASRMTFLQHLHELRKRLRNAGIVLVVSALAASYFAWDFFQFLIRPVERALLQLNKEPTFIMTEPSEAFWVQFKLALILGLAATLPLVCWELWKFVAPGLYRREKKLALALTATTVVCFLGGAVFGYALLSKTTHLFLLGSGPPPSLSGGKVEIMLTIHAVVDFQITMLLGAGVAFELPVVIGVLGWMGLVDAGSLWRFNRYALVLSAAAGAILTPGADVYSQLLLAGPLFALYNLSIGLVWLIERRTKRAEIESPLLLLVCAWPVLRRHHAARAA